MDILLKAKELGEMIAESEEMKRLKNAEAALESDDRGMQLMEDHRLLQIELVKATREKKGDVQIGEIRDMLVAKQNELNEYHNTNEYIESKNGFDSLMKKINDVITFTITGEECTHSCDTCGGCGHSH